MRISKREIADALYLSCVENYFLAWLGTMYDVTKLYGSSFIGIAQVLRDFSRGAAYENYGAVPRMQDVAEEFGIVRHEYRRCSAREAARLLREQPAGALCLVRVNADFFAGYTRAAWREDHYVCMDRELRWINQYPLSEGEYDFGQFCRVYGGAVISYLPHDLTAAIPERMGKAIAGQSFSGLCLPQCAGEAESAIGVLRVTRKRMEQYYAAHEKMQTLLNKENKLLDEIYFTLRLKRIKDRGAQGPCAGGKNAVESIREPLEKVFDAEREMAEVMRNEA